MTGGLAETVRREGFALVPNVLNAQAISNLIDIMQCADVARSARKAATYGARNILDVPAVAEIATISMVSQVVADCIGPGARPVRGIFFDKTIEANWPVAWHQDLTLAVAERHELEGWSTWSTKAGVVHVQPPTDVLERMITLRFHLDECDADNGPLKVLAGTHKMGRISAEQMQHLRAARTEHVCLAPAGSALVMKPLLLHASSAARVPRHRRILHIEFAPTDLLPAPLQWRQAGWQ